MSNRNLNPNKPNGSSKGERRNPDWTTESTSPVLQTPIRVPVQPMIGAEPLMCVINVRKRIAAMGGKSVFGWCVEHDPFNDRHQSHVLWEDDRSQLWDVTPVFGAIAGKMVTVEWRDSIDFIRDDSAVFDTKSLPGRYVPTHKSPYVAKACQYMTRADEFLMVQQNLEKCRYWTERANAEMKKSRLNAYWAVPDSLNVDDLLKAGLPPDEQHPIR